MSRNISAFKSSRAESQYFTAYDAALRLQPVPYEEFDVTTSHGQIHIISRGAIDASPLLRVHGGYASSTVWFPNIGELRSRFHVLVIDTIGEPDRSIPILLNASKCWSHALARATGT